MRIAAQRGSSLHAPENSVAALIAGYTGGADVLEIGLQLTRDGHLVLSHHATTDTMTGTPGRIADMTLHELRELDFSSTYQPRGSANFRYYTASKQKMAIATFPDVLETLPEEVEFLIQIGNGAESTPGGHRALVSATANAISSRFVTERCVVISPNAGVLKMLRQALPAIRTATMGERLSAKDQLDLMMSTGADGMLTTIKDLLDGKVLTPFATEFQKTFRDKQLRVGAIVRPPSSTGVFVEQDWAALGEHKFVWSLGTDSLLDVAFTRRSILLTEESFKGRTVDRTRFSLGYAKANQYCTLYQGNGIHIQIDPYPEPPPPPENPGLRWVEHVEERLVDARRNWPFYSGGGVGYVPGIRANFVAEVDYSVDNVGQATTLEMAVVNVDPGAHRSKKPTSSRDMDPFYDPHGAPPFVGVEHDEDDGYRINWNLGSGYDTNQYGRSVGDGSTPRAGRLRLERRREYFAAYYRNTVDAADWVCCGVARNLSLNDVVYLRCAGKRWRKASPSDPDKYLPVRANHFVFKNLRIERVLD